MITGIDQRLYRKGLELIGEVRGGIEYSRLCARSVKYADTLIEFTSLTDSARVFLSDSGIPFEYASSNAAEIIRRMHFNEGRNLFLILLLPMDATDTQLTKRWKTLMRIYHPDVNPHSQAEECSKRINEAYSTLKDLDKRRRYCVELKRQTLMITRNEKWHRSSSIASAGLIVGKHRQHNETKQIPFVSILCLACVVAALAIFLATNWDLLDAFPQLGRHDAVDLNGSASPTKQVVGSAASSSLNHSRHKGGETDGK